MNKKNEMNEYYKDSIIFIKKASEKISPLISDEDLIITMLSFALGLERIFKGILFDINPIYVLIEDSFKGSAPILYKNKFLPSFKKNEEINLKASGDQITFRKALSRAKLFSQTANRYSGLFHRVSYSRDIIAHCELSKIEYVKDKEILNRDFITVLKSFRNELNIPEFTNSIDSNSYFVLEEISNNLIKAEEIEKKVNSKLENHLNIWETRKNNPDELQKAKDKTESIIDTYAKHYSYESFECPACKNTAIISLELETGIVEDEEVGGHLSLTELRCYYCDLNLSDYEELDYLELERSYYEEEYLNSMNDYYES